jgi:DNA-binding protein
MAENQEKQEKQQGQQGPEQRTGRQRFEKRRDQQNRYQSRRGGRASDNTVFVGKKPSMSYVLAVVTQFSNGQNEIHIKARGRAISKAVDVAEIVKNKFIQDVKVADIKIGTEEVQIENNEKLNISTMEITLRK